MTINTSARFSPVIAGTMKWGQWGSKFDTSSYESIIEDCISIGVTSFDHADIYGHYTTEAEFGTVLKTKPHLRQKMQLISKCGIKMITANRPDHKIKSYDTSFEHIIASAERSLKNLHTDHLDLLLIHRPDPLLDPDAIARAFEYLHQQGKVLFFGVSNFNASQTAMIRDRYPIMSNQIEASLFHLPPFLDGTIDYSIAKKLTTMAWSPLGGGALWGDVQDERVVRIKQVAAALCEKYQCSDDQLYLAWLMKHPAGIIPVLGTSKMERIKSALNSKHISIEREEWFRLWSASTGAEVP